MSAAGVFLRYRQYLAGFGGDWYNWLRQKEELLAGGADPDARLMMYHTYEEAKQN